MKAAKALKVLRFRRRCGQGRGHSKKSDARPGLACADCCVNHAPKKAAWLRGMRQCRFCCAETFPGMEFIQGSWWYICMTPMPPPCKKQQRMQSPHQLLFVDVSARVCRATAAAVASALSFVRSGDFKRFPFAQESCRTDLAVASALFFVRSGICHA